MEEIITKILQEAYKYDPEYNKELQTLLDQYVRFPSNRNKTFNSIVALTDKKNKWIESMIKILEGLKKEPIKWGCGKIIAEDDRDYDGSIKHYHSDSENDDDYCDIHGVLSGWDALGANKMIAETNKQIDQAIQQLKTYIN